MKKILVVDDDPSLLALVRVFLKDHYLVETCLDGDLAIKSVNQSPPDLIITDVLMPEMTGYELFINLKRIDSPARRAPIVVMSSKESLQFIFDAQAIISFLPKPFTKTELCSAVEAALKS